MSRRRQPARPKAKNYPCPSLDGLLRMWEDACFWHSGVELINRQFVRRNPLGPAQLNWHPGGAFENFRKFRSYVLSIHQKDPEMRDIAQFHWPLPRNEVSHADSETLALLHWVPIEIASWSLFSRRIYALTPELQAILAATSLGNLSWNDVKLPFDSYAIRLARPIRMAPGEVVDYLLVTRRRDEHVFFRGISPKVAGYEAGSSKVKRRFENLLAEGNLNEALDLNLGEMKRFGVANYGANLVMPASLMDKPIRQSIDNTIDQGLVAQEAGVRSFTLEEVQAAQEGIGAAINVAVGLALYMQTLKSRESHCSDWDKLPCKNADPRAISSRSLLCSVTHSYQLSAEERIMLGLDKTSERKRAEIALAWQFVSGYWRRLPGLGKDPSAPRTEHIRSYMRRRDLMPEDEGLPGGAEQTW